MKYLLTLLLFGTVAYGQSGSGEVLPSGHILYWTNQDCYVIPVKPGSLEHINLSCRTESTDPIDVPAVPESYVVHYKGESRNDCNMSVNGMSTAMYCLPYSANVYGKRWACQDKKRVLLGSEDHKVNVCHRVQLCDSTDGISGCGTVMLTTLQ